MAKTQISQTFAGQVGCEKVEINVSRVWTTVVIGLVILNALEIDTQISLLGQMTNRFQIARTVEPSWWLNGLDNLASFPQCSNLRGHSVCLNSVTNFRCSPVDAHILVSLVVSGTVHPTRSADSQDFCRSVMDNSEPGASKSDLGLGIIDTACLFCVAGSDWWANYNSLLEDFGLKHEIDELVKLRYKFGDGGTLVSSIRVTAPIFVAGKKGRICFQRGSFETPALVDWSRFPDSCQSCCGYGREDAQDWNWRR